MLAQQKKEQHSLKNIHLVVMIHLGFETSLYDSKSCDYYIIVLPRFVNSA